jgi:hypothetical protein
MCFLSMGMVKMSNNHSLPHKCDKDLRKRVIANLLQQQYKKQKVLADFIGEQNEKNIY